MFHTNFANEGLNCFSVPRGLMSDACDYLQLVFQVWAELDICKSQFLKRAAHRSNASQRSKWGNPQDVNTVNKTPAWTGYYTELWACLSFAVQLFHVVQIKPVVPHQTLCNMICSLLNFFSINVICRTPQHIQISYQALKNSIRTAVNSRFCFLSY